MDKEKVKKYWQDVRRRALEDAMSKSGASLLFLSGLIIVFAVIAISGVLYAMGIIKYPFFKDNIVANNITGIAQIIVAVILVAIFYDRALHEIPPKMYEEIGGFIENPFELSARPPLPKSHNEPRWASINVINISHLKIENCFVTLDDILDETGKSILYSRQRNLLWSWGEGANNRNKELDIFPKVPRIVDIATTWPNNEDLRFETWAGVENKPNGTYELIISAHGQWKDLPQHKTKRFIIEYLGNNVVTIIEKGKEKWTDSDPKKPDKNLEYLYDPSS